jgi:hypothetical protein
LAGYRERQVSSGDLDASASTYKAALVQPAAFTMLGARPALGRLIADEDTRDGAARSVVIGWNLWQTRYGGADNASARS